MKPYRSLMWLLLLVSLVVLAGCETENDAEYARPQIDIRFAPGVSQQAINLTRIVIIIEGSDLTPIKTVEIKEIKSGQRRLSYSDLVPLEAAAIRVEAYEVDEGGQERLALTGESPLENLAQPAPKVVVWLDPVTAHLKLKALKIDLGINETFIVEIIVANVTDLFSMSLELEFDNKLLEPTGVSAGAMMGEKPLVFDDLSLDRPANRVGIALALRGGDKGISGSGTVATIGFRAKAAGTAAVRVVNTRESKVFAMQKANGEPIAGFDRLAEFLPRAEVIVNIK